MATVISFYSDRDGIGRSMAVATIGWILATNGKRVAVLDWDLRKPTLHKYLGPFLPDNASRSEIGVIDVLWHYGVLARRAPAVDPGTILQVSAEGIGCSCTIPAEFPLMDGGKLRFIHAGAEKMRNIRVRYFNWGEFVDCLEGRHAIKHFLDGIGSAYDLILIDLPSGRVTYSMALPASESNVLVACFSLDRESIDTTSATSQWFRDRIKNTDLTIVPVAMMVEPAEMGLKVRTRQYAQERFERLIRNQLPGPNARNWSPTNIPEIPYIPYYKYVRRLPLHDDGWSSLIRSYLRLADNVSPGAELALPDPDPTGDDRLKYLDEFGDTHAVDDIVYDHPLPQPYLGDEPYAFLSYARDDQDEVLRWIQELAELGFRIWWDDGILPGSDWQSHLDGKIYQCRHLLLFLSVRSVTSLHVQRELGIASAIGKPVLGVRLDWTEIIPAYKEYLSRYQMLDSGSPNFEKDLGRGMLDVLSCDSA